MGPAGTIANPVITYCSRFGLGGLTKVLTSPNKSSVLRLAMRWLLLHVFANHLACFVTARDAKLDGFIHFCNVSMERSIPYVSNVTPGDGAEPLGAKQTAADLELAKHICDRYEHCRWFNSHRSRGVDYPGAIGRWSFNSSWDTYLKNTTGTVVSGSAYFATKYLHISDLNVFCERIDMTESMPADVWVARCKGRASCHGFTVHNDLLYSSRGFLCAFDNVGGPFDSFLRLPSV